MARRAGLHDQRPEFLPALFFLSFALLVVTASLVAFELLHNGVYLPLLFVKPRQNHGGQRLVCEGHI